MTTKVTVDTHAGWPVRVTTVKVYGPSREETDTIVEPNEVREFFVYEGSYIEVHEMRKAGE